MRRQKRNPKKCGVVNRLLPPSPQASQCDNTVITSACTPRKLTGKWVGSIASHLGRRSLIIPLNGWYHAKVSFEDAALLAAANFGFRYILEQQFLNPQGNGGAKSKFNKVVRQSSCMSTLLSDILMPACALSDVRPLPDMPCSMSWDAWDNLAALKLSCFKGSVHIYRLLLDDAIAGRQL